jgi:hypothetical protein
MVAWLAIGDDAHACPALHVPILVGWITSFFSPARLLRSDIAVLQWYVEMAILGAAFANQPKAADGSIT